MAKRRAHGEGSVFQLKNGKWRAEIDFGMVDGKRVRPQRTARTQREAQIKLRQLRQLAAAGVAPSGSTTVDEWLDYWIGEIKVNIAPKTRYEYRANIRRHISPAIGGRKLNALQPEHIDAIYRTMIKKGLGVSSIRQVHAVITASMNDAVKRRKIAYSPADAVEIPNGANGRAKAPMPHAQWNADQALKALEAAKGDASEHARMICAVMLALRSGEALGLQWSYVHEDDADPYIEVAHNLRRGEAQKGGKRPLELGPTKTKHAREIPLPDLAADAFRRLRAQRRDGDDFVFPSNVVGRPRLDRDDWQMMRDIADRAGVARIPRHGARGTAATVLADMGVPLITVAAILGHTDIATTVKHYARADRSMQAKGLNQLSESWRDALSPGKR